MESPLLLFPAELLNRIFESCDDFQQVVSLASACKLTQTVWLTNSSSIVWTVGVAQIRSFDDALMAVRATAIVLKAYQAGTLPPAVTQINSLSGKSKLPEIAELKEVLNMQRLVQCIEHIYFNAQFRTRFTSSLFPNMTGDRDDDDDERFCYGPPKYPAERRRFPNCLEEGIPGAENATIAAFRDSFFRAMYRLLLAGAVVARAYMAPVFQAREERNTEFYRLWGYGRWVDATDRLSLEDPGSDSDKADTDSLSLEYQGYHSDGGGGGGSTSAIDAYYQNYPTEEDRAVIRQYPVYNWDVLDSSEIGQWRNQEYESCFGPFASWIIEDGRQRKHNETQDHIEIQPDWAKNREDVGAVQELMLLLVAYEHSNNCFRNDFWWSVKGSRTVSIVRFGVFHVEEITMPPAINFLTHLALPTRNHPALKGTAGRNIPHQIKVESITLRLQSETRTPIPFHYEHQGPPASLELWQHALRQLDLTFRAKTFWIPADLDCIWWREVGRGDIFLNPDWNVVQKYDPEVVSWDWRNY